MNTVETGTENRQKHNWGAAWYEGYDAIDWHRQEQQPRAATRRAFGLMVEAEDADKLDLRQPAWAGVAEPIHTFEQAVAGRSGGWNHERPVSRANLNFGTVTGDGCLGWGIND